MELKRTARDHLMLDINFVLEFVYKRGTQHVRFTSFIVSRLASTLSASAHVLPIIKDVFV